MVQDVIRRCSPDEQPRVLAIINDAAERYRDVIPEDRWQDPYMSEAHLAEELAAGVTFSGLKRGGELVGVMGVQPVEDVILIRHAYVANQAQGGGVGGALLRHLMAGVDRPILLGTWAAADWAIGFYLKQGFELVSPEETAPLLRRYWNVPARQVETSVVLRLRDRTEHRTGF